MKKIQTSRFDIAEHLRTPEEMAAYLEAVMQDAPGDAARIARALGDIARAKGMTQVTRSKAVELIACTAVPCVAQQREARVARLPVLHSGFWTERCRRIRPAHRDITTACPA